MTIITQGPMSSSSTRYEPLLLRHPANPILTSKDWPYSINSVFNAGATLLADGTTLLLCRVEDRRGLSHLCAARSPNAVDGCKIYKTAPLWRAPDPVEDSRGGLGFYRGVRHPPSGCLYRLGLALFDLENPEKCLLRGDS